MNCNYKTANTPDLITVINNQECDLLINELISENIVKYKVEQMNQKILSSGKTRRF